MNKVLVAYASKSLQVQGIAQAVARALRSRCLLINMSDKAFDRDVGKLEDYRAVVLGTPVKFGRAHSDFVKFVKRNKKELAAKKLIIYACGGASPEKCEDRIKKKLPMPINKASVLYFHIEEGEKVDPDALNNLCREAERIY
ncbi:MAG TPA: flavodoxin domain-containing protein [Bacillota bacterium]|nr:flavodoxin domain-containing protein [Bacillota bacterium]